jgi:hypothetical protein
MMVLDFGWNTKFIVKTEDALKIINILEKAEMYEEKWRKEEEGGTTYHVWPVGDKLPGLKIVSESLYQMAKLAGKPEKA